jgi:hypothetical protein
MAKGFKIKKNFNFKKLARKLPDIIEDNLNILGAHVNRAIQDGIDKGRDINGNAFDRLSSDSTTQLREGSTPLKDRGILRRTKLTKATAANPVFKIEMVGKSQKTLPTLSGKKVNRKAAGKIYGAFHNQKDGYITSPKSAIPNKKVPQRKWFGMPSSALPGGKEYDKASARRRIHIRQALKTVMQ